MERFITHYNRLDEAVKQHLVVENDDRSYTIKDVLDIGEKLTQATEKAKFLASMEMYKQRKV